MSQKYFVNSHVVTVEEIAAVEPLIENSRIASPESGLILRLDDGSRHIWRAAKGEAMPLVGDCHISDSELHLVYVVPAAKFAELFTEQ